MPRAKGTYGTLSNWVLESAPGLPQAAGWVLQALERQSNYRTPTMGLTELCEATYREADQVRRGLVFLTTYGLAVQVGRAYQIGEPSRLKEALEAAGTRKEEGLKARLKGRLEARLKADSDHSAMPTDTTKTAPLKEEKELKEKKEQTKNPPPPQGEARNITAPVVQDQTPVQVTEPIRSPDGEAADAAPVVSPVQAPAQPVTGQTEPATNTEKVPAARRAAPSADQAMFGAVALACYGGHDGLTDITRSRIGKVGKSLTKAGYTAADVGLIVAELRQEQWRDSITPSVIEAEAPAWRARQRGSLPARPDRAHVLKFPAPAPPLDNGEIDMDALIRNAPLNGTRRKA